MKKPIITITIDAVNDRIARLVCVDASVERERQSVDDDLDIRDYEYISDASVRRLQRAQLRLIEQEREL